MKLLKITSVGNSAGIVLPEEILKRLRAREGDTVLAIETPNGVELRPYDPESDRQMDIAEQVMQEHRYVLKKLAK